VAAVNALGAVMDEGGEYRITRSKGWGLRRKIHKIHKVIFRHLDEAPARRFYERTPSADGYVISLWHPDGTLIASISGPVPAS
jgi:hypothetical protein